MEIQLLTSLLVLQYSLESQKTKTAMAESKPQISDYIQVEGKAVTFKHQSLNLEADYSLGRPCKPCFRVDEEFKSLPTFTEHAIFSGGHRDIMNFGWC